MSSTDHQKKLVSSDHNSNDYTFYMLCTLLLLSFVIICIQIPTNNIFPFPFPGPHHISNSQYCGDQSSKPHNKNDHVANSAEKKSDDELEDALAKAATEDKTVIIALVNKAYVEGDKPMFDLFLDGFWLGDGTRDLIKHVLIVALDQTSYDRCQFLHLHCYKLQTEGVDFAAAEEMFMSVNFVKLVWRRIQFLADVAKRGYNFIFTDTDILWLRNPFPNLKLDESIDFQISSDYIDRNKDLQQLFVNTGMYMMRSNNKTIALLDAWYANQDYKRKEQDILVNLLKDGLVHKLGIKLHFLDTLYFSGFCQNSKDVSKVITVHANCCVSIAAKVSDLIATLHDWKRYKTSSHHHTHTSTSFKWSEHSACINASKNF